MAITVDAELCLLALAVFAVAALYSSVGHAGASGYISVMSLLGLAPAVIKPTSLALNVVVSIITTWQFWRAGHFKWELFWPFALLSTPFALLGGYLTLSTDGFRLLLGVGLVVSAGRLLVYPAEDAEGVMPSRGVALSLGAAIGLLAGLTGTGGGIFLTPILLFKRWAKTREISAVSAAFILTNSTAGLLGYVSAKHTFPWEGLLLLPVVVVAGLLGSRLGSRHLPHTVIKRVLAIVLLVAATKLIALA